MLWAKWLMPEEEALQDRHDVPTSAEERLMTQATLAQAALDAGLPRRSMLLRSLGLAGGALATVPLVALVGALIKKPGKQLDHTPYGTAAAASTPTGVPIIYSDGRRVSPDDMQAGGIATVFPVGYVSDASSPTLIIRLRPGPDGQVPQGPGRLRLGRLRRVLQDLHARRLPGLAVRAADQPAAVPVPPVAVRGARGREAGVRARRPVRCPSCRSGSRSWTGASTSSP